MTTALYDQFLGTVGTLLSDHTADSGGTWDSASGYALRTGGGINQNGGGSVRAFSSVAIPANPKLTFTFSKGINVGSTWIIYLGSYSGATATTGTGPSTGVSAAGIRYSSGVTTLVRYTGSNINDYTDIATLDTQSSGTPSGIPSSNEVIVDGSTVTFNGVEYAFGGSLAEGDSLIVFAYSAATTSTNRALLKSVLLESIVPPVIPEWWTSLRNATEDV